jgi:hypothetical protein
MKLYTEEQVRQMLFDLGSVLFNNNQNGIEEGEPATHFDYIIEDCTPIELPSDEDLEDMRKAYIQNINTIVHADLERDGYLSVGFHQGAKWMRDKIEGGNK